VRSQNTSRSQALGIAAAGPWPAGLPEAADGPLSPAGLAELTAGLAGAGWWTGPAAGGPADQAWAVPLLATPAVEAWLLGWPAGLATPAHDHAGSAVALTVVAGALSEECLDPTIWTTGRRTTWRAGSTTLFPPGHVHLLGAAGSQPAVAVHAWSDPSADRGAGRPALGGGGAVAGGGRRSGRGAGAAVGRDGGGRGCRAEHPTDGALDLRHVGDRVAG
jgi:quercetin dioxygenase-like cupin family protein